MAREGGRGGGEGGGIERPNFRSVGKSTENGTVPWKYDDGITARFEKLEYRELK